MSKKPLSVAAIELADAATSRLSAWRQTLTLLASGGIRDVGESDFLGRELRAAASVATISELERLLRELLVATAEEVNSAGVKVCDLTPPLRTLATQAHFQTIAVSSKSDKHWDSRQIVTRLETNEEVAHLPPRSGSNPQPPLDGRTIRSSHLHRLWKVIGLAEPALPNAEIEASLNALSTLRNDVAHGNAPLTELFHPDVPGKSAVDIEAHVRNIERLIDHLALAFHDYGRLKQYRLTV